MKKLLLILLLPLSVVAQPIHYYEIGITNIGVNAWTFSGSDITADVTENVGGVIHDYAFSDLNTNPSVTLTAGQVAWIGGNVEGYGAPQTLTIAIAGITNNSDVTTGWYGESLGGSNYLITGGVPFDWDALSAGPGGGGVGGLTNASISFFATLDQSNNFVAAVAAAESSQDYKLGTWTDITMWFLSGFSSGLTLLAPVVIILFIIYGLRLRMPSGD